VTSVHVVIAGMVQGVGYRYWLSREARAAGISGWARNTRDGNVEAVLAGDDEAVARLVERCKIGPGSARVTGVTQEPAPEPQTPDFRILPDR
jgi:acylphosphatase